jgi:hypothetical protein
LGYRKEICAGCWWLRPVILGTQEAEIRRIMVRSQPRQIVCKTLSQKILQKNRAGGVAQGEVPELQCCCCCCKKEIFCNWIILIITTQFFPP